MLRKYLIMCVVHTVSVVLTLKIKNIFIIYNLLLVNGFLFSRFSLDWYGLM